MKKLVLAMMLGLFTTIALGTHSAYACDCGGEPKKCDKGCDHKECKGDCKKAAPNAEKPKK